MVPATLPSPTEVAFTLDGKDYTEGDVQQAFRRYTAGTKMTENEIASRLQPSHPSHRQVVDAMIEEVLLEKDAADHKVTISEAEIDAGIDKMFNRMLKDQSLSRDQFAKRVQQVTGMNLDDYLKVSRPRLRRQIVVEKVGRELFKDLAVTDNEVQSHYDKSPVYKTPKVRASHILIGNQNPREPMTPEQKAEARKKADEVAAQAKKEGADFAALAKEYSVDKTSAEQGGDLGFFQRQGQMVEPFAAAAFALKPGQVSDVVESQFGFHIIKMTATQPARELSDVSGEIREDLKMNKLFGKMRDHLQELRTKATIKYPPGKEPATRPAFNPAMMRPQSPTTGPAGARLRPMPPTPNTTRPAVNIRPAAPGTRPATR